MPERQRKKSLGNAANAIGFAIIIFVVVSQLGSYVGRWAIGTVYPNTSAQPAPEWIRAGLALLLSLISFILPYRFLAKQKDAQQENLPLKKSKISVWVLLPLFLGSAVVVNAAASLLQGIVVALFKLKGLALLTLPESFSGRVVYFAAVCVVAPILEELFFRGAIQGMLRPWGHFFAILVTAILFTLVHSNLMDLPAVFALGLLLGYVAEISGSVAVCIVLHGANNLYTFIGMLIRENFRDVSAIAVIFWVTAVIFAFFLGALWFVRSTKIGRRFFLKGIPQQDKISKRLLLLCKEPVFVAGVLFAAVSFILRVFLT